MELINHAIPCGVDFLTGAAGHIVEFAEALGLPAAELSSLELILPNLKLANDCSQALRIRCGGTVLLPHMATLSGMTEPWLRDLDVVPDAQRQLILHAQLRSHKWFDESLLWEIVGELTTLFDTLTEHAVQLPENETELLSRIEEAFGLNDSAPLAFEARLVNTLWLAEAQGRPSRTAARLIACRQWMDSLRQPLVVIAEERNAGLLQAALEELATRLPVLLLCPERRLSSSGYAAVLEAAWPAAAGHDEESALSVRAAGLPDTALVETRNRLRMVSADSLEELAQAVTDQVLDWAEAGRQRIALIALDRLAARRARALLEREGVLLQDETGWKMSTTRVAAVADSWLEVLASDAYHRALIDLLRAPLLFSDLTDDRKSENALAVESLVQQSGVASGIERLIRAAPAGSAAADVLLRLQNAADVMASGRPASICDWLQRLRDSLAILGALPLIERDSAGRDWLEWLSTRQAELAGETSLFSFASWRHWFNQQMDGSLYRDESIDSPVVLTHLAATRLRTFEGVILVGADAEHLTPAAQQFWLAHDGVRRTLGLPALSEAVLQQREDLASLLLNSDKVLVAWQSRQAGEELLPAPEIATLTALFGMYGQAPVERHVAWQIRPDADYVPEKNAPVIPAGRIPVRLSASAMQTLLSCPFHYFARYVLRLGEQDMLSEEMEKSEFGELLHGILKKFHETIGFVAHEDPDLILQALSDLTDRDFAEAVGRNFRDHAWRLRWRSRMQAYLDWQRAREQDGWRWQEGETERACDLSLTDRHTLRLIGRIDRIDVREQNGQRHFALLDYKSRGMSALRNQVRDPDDVQLAFYALLHDMDVEQAGYVALDDDSPGMAQIAQPMERAKQLQDCITACFDGMYGGQALPAQGSATACAYCEMRGLCRKEWRE